MFQPTRCEKLKKILAPLLLALLAVSLTAVVYGHENGDIQRTREQENEREHEMERRLDIIDTPTAILIRSKVENGTVENHFGLLVTTQHRTEEASFVNGIVIHVAFSHETEVGDVENEAFLHLKIAYFRLTEFNDTNADGAYDAGVDNVVKFVDLTQKSYAPLTRANIVSDDGKPGWQITAKTTDGLFEVTADIFPQYAVVDNTIVPPTATKITTRINGFQFSNPTSRIALQLMATSRTVIEHETPTTEEKIRVRSATAEGFFTWAPTADVDGTPVEVKSSTQRLERPRWIINLAYPQGNSIVHDPILGFDFGTTPILTSRLLIGAAIAAITVFGVLVYLGRRQLVRVFTPKPMSQ